MGREWGGSPPSFGCFSTLERFDTLTDELFDNPLLPLLFIGETVKLATLSLVGEATWIAAALMALLSIPTTVLWYHLGDEIEDAVDSAAEDLTDGDGS